jgi:hypothetical protein
MAWQELKYPRERIGWSTWVCVVISIFMTVFMFGTFLMLYLRGLF